MWSADLTPRERLLSPWLIGTLGALVGLALALMFPRERLEARLLEGGKVDALSVAYLEAWLRVRPNDGEFLSVLAAQYVRTGRLEEAEAMVARMRALRDASIEREALLLDIAIREQRAYALQPKDPQRAALLDNLRGLLKQALGYKWTAAELEILANKARGLDQGAIAMQFYQRLAKQDVAHTAHWQARAAEIALGVGEYRAAAAANDDELVWLGPLPAEWSRDDVQKQLDDVYGKIKHELDNLGDADIDVSRFVCRSPDQIGPAPDQQAVIDYMSSLREPGSTTPAQWTALVEAARKGNWLARLQIFVALGSRPKDDLVSVYRRIQLMGWLQANHVGALYTYYLGELAATGYFEGPGPGATSPIPLYAAMHGSYAAMKRAGDSLMARDEPDVQAIGKRMHDCALQMMPVLFAK